MPGAARPLALAALALAACAGPARPRPEAPALGVSALRVDFARADEGLLEFSVPLPEKLPPLRAVSWELWVRGRRFATGLEGSPAVVDAPGGREVQLQAPLVFRHLGWREGSAWVEVRLSGELLVGDEGAPAGVPFRGQREVLAHGVPELEESQD